MKKKILSLLAAFFMLFGTSAMAQVDSTLEGDVNGDGVVDIADITAVIAIIKQNAEANPTYYWYVGTSNPSTMTSISPVVNDNTSTGWRLIGASVPTYTMANPLWDGQVNYIAFNPNYDAVDAYIALPNNVIKVRDGLGNDVTSELQSLGTKNINGVNYYIYKNRLGENETMQYVLDLLVY